MKPLPKLGASNGEIAVLIPHYNDLPGLHRALASLAGEGVSVIVVDDGSIMRPQHQALRDAYPYIKKLHVINLAEHIGMAQALNVGLSYASNYEFIARLDCGDQCLPGRMQQQKAFLQSHPQHHLVGCWAEYIDDSTSARLVQRYPSEHEDILGAMYRRNVFCHSATMFRRDSALAVGGYPINVEAAEDYALFFAMAKAYHVANIPQVLVKCYTIKASLSARQARNRLLSSIRVIAKNIKPAYLMPASRSIASASMRLVMGVDNTAYFAYPANDFAGEGAMEQDAKARKRANKVV
jgi:glycosyltransferase involved in cell wall biosynthesis